MTPTDFARHLTRYLGEHLPSHRNLSANTVASYRDVFTLLLRYCQDHHGLTPDRLQLKHLRVPLIQEFLDHLQTQRHCSARTRNQRLAALHAFFRFLQSEAPEHMVECQKILAIPFQRHERRSVAYLEAGDLNALLAQPDAATAQGRRHAVLLRVLYDTGARVQEVIDLRIADIRLETPAQVRLTGKGRKTRVVPLMSDTVAALAAYLREQRPQDPARADEPLFVNRHGQRLSRSGVGYLLAKYSGQARQRHSGLPASISPHVLRHSKAMHLLQSGNPMPSIQAILGHADIRTCTIYANADMNMKRQALEKAAPIAPSAALPSWQSNPQLMDWLRSL
jgi:site-specific recombinase XerD